MQGNLSRCSEPVKHNDEKALDAKYAVEDLRQEVADLYADMFNATQTDFENQLSIMQHKANMIEKSMADTRTRGYLDSAKYYEELSRIENGRIEKMNEELEGLRQKFEEAMDSGVIEYQSEAWYSMAASVNEVEEAIADANTKLIEYQKTMRSINWSYFDYAQERFGQLQQEANFLIGIMSNDKLFEDNGQFAEKGTATMGLRVANYNAYMTQADAYAKEMQKINKEIAKNPYDTELIARREALLQLQQQSIQAAESEKDAIKDLVSQGIQLELKALKDLIDEYTEMMSAEKELYDYEKNVRDKTNTVAKLQKQITAYGGDDSEENIARMQKLQESLQKAQEDLAETEWEHTISEQKKMLDQFYEDYSDLLNARLDDLESLVEEMTGRVNEHIEEIGTELHASAEQVGYTISDAVNTILDSEEMDQTFAYYDKVFDGVTTVNTYLDSINQRVEQMVEISNRIAAASAKHDDSHPYGNSDTATQNSMDAINQAVNEINGTPGVNGSYGQSSGSHGIRLKVSAERAMEEMMRAGYWTITSHLGVDLEHLDEIPENKREVWNRILAEFKERRPESYNKIFQEYSTGGLADYTGPAMLHGTKRRPELVLNADDTERFLQAAKLMRTPVLNALTDRAITLPEFGEGGGITIENFNADFNFEHVDSYDDMLRQMQGDRRFERLVTTITSDQYVNRRSKFSKYNVPI